MFGVATGLSSYGAPSSRMRDARGAEIRSLREALSMLGERQRVGIVVAEASGAVVFATARAQRLLGAASIVPAELHPHVEGAVLARDGDVARGGGVSLPGSRNRVSVKTTLLAGTPLRVLLVLHEEGPGGTLTQRLVERYGLSPRSVELVELASRGLKNREIGVRMKLAEATVKTYMHAVFRELGVRNRAELVALAERLARDGSA